MYFSFVRQVIDMLTNSPVTPTVPVTGIEVAKDFYTNKLGLKVNSMPEKDGILFDAGNGTQLFIYKRGPSKADHTLASFSVENVEATVDELSQKGVVFEQYDMPNGIKTDAKGIARMGETTAAWFKDPDGNIFSVLETRK